MNKNGTANRARRGKYDEFYTQLSDIENELRHYKRHFRGKTVYCNCDDPRISNFWQYFALNFQRLGLKKLVTTCYRNQNPELFSRHDSERAVKLEYDGYREGENVPRPEDIGLTHLTGDGDFRSPECIEILKGADIVVTNPPFSLFREYVSQLIEHDKKFLIIGHQNAMTYKDVFPLIRNNQLWLGRGFKRNCAHFIAPTYEDYATDEDHREGMIRVSGVMWFTNLDHAKRHEDLILYKRYSPEEYPKYDNYDAINVNYTAEIPEHYDGAMGVPITFLTKHNPDQFEIIGMCSELVGSRGKGRFYVNGQRMYVRIVIRHRRNTA